MAHYVSRSIVLNALMCDMKALDIQIFIKLQHVCGQEVVSHMKTVNKRREKEQTSNAEKRVKRPCFAQAAP